MHFQETLWSANAFIFQYSAASYRMIRLPNIVWH